MTSQIHTPNQRSKKETQDLSSTSVQGMFQPRPSVMQAQTASQGAELNTSLRRAEKYGHNLNQMHPTSISDITALQPKLDVTQPVQRKPKKTSQKPEERRKQGDHVFNDFTGDTQELIGGNMPFHSGVGIESEYRKQKVDYSSDGLDNATNYGEQKKNAESDLKKVRDNNVKPGSKRNRDYQNAISSLTHMQENAVDQNALEQKQGNKIVEHTDKYRKGLEGMNDRVVDQYILSEQYKADKK